MPSLDKLIEDFLRDGVDLVAIAGMDYAKIEDIIDEIIVGDGSNSARFINTTSHKSLDDAIAFAESWPTNAFDNVQIVEL